MNDLDTLATQLANYVMNFSAKDQGVKALAVAAHRALLALRTRNDLDRLDFGKLKRMLRDRIKAELLEEGEVRDRFAFVDRKFAVTLLKCWP
jgi:hypothetical protein